LNTPEFTPVLFDLSSLVVCPYPLKGSVQTIPVILLSVRQRAAMFSSASSAQQLELLLDAALLMYLCGATLRKLRLPRFLPPEPFATGLPLLASILLHALRPSAGSAAVLRVLCAFAGQDLFLLLSRDMSFSSLGHWVPVGPLVSCLVFALLLPTPPVDGMLLFARAGEPSMWLVTFVLSAGTVAALYAWSWYVGGRHGPIQGLDEIISPTSLLPLAIFNAAVEELEFRVLLQSALYRMPDSILTMTELLTSSRALYSVFVSNVFFAVLHVMGGFPRGRVGFAMVLLWGSLLGALRLLTGGMLQPLLVHVAADTAIFLIIQAHCKPARRGAMAADGVVLEAKNAAAPARASRSRSAKVE
jgi:hypothetical protein